MAGHSGCAACDYSGHSQSQLRSCGAVPAEHEFRFVIVPVQPEMDVGVIGCVSGEMAGVGGKTATRIVCLEG